MTVLNQLLLSGTDLRPITCIGHEHQLWLYRNMTHYPEADHAHLVSVRQSSVETKGIPRVHDFSKSIDPVKKYLGYLGWEGGQLGGLPGYGVIEWAGQHAPLCIPTLIDIL